MNFLLWAVTTALVLGVTEAVIKPLAKRWVQRRLLAAAPAVLRQIDAVLPELVLTCTGPELEAAVRAAFEQATGESWAHENLNPFFELYDIRKAALNIGTTERTANLQS